ncbi:MAG: VCBS domain-containing protein, partial [Olleya sp.]
TNGTFSIGSDGVWTFTANSAFNELNVGQNVAETFTVASVDGTTSTVTVQINGTNDAAIVSSASVELAETDAPLTTGGSLTASDMDNVDNAFVAQTDVIGSHGTFSIGSDGAWTFTANSAFNALNVGDNVSEQFTVTSVDGTASTVQITINGTNDTPVLSVSNLAATEDDEAISGTVEFSDVDGTATVAITEGNNLPTGLILNPDGIYSFDASSYDDLTEGQKLVIEVPLTVTDNDGATTTTALTITVTGTNDAPTAVVESALVTEDATVSGTVEFVDVDGTATVAVTTGEETPEGLSLNNDGSYTFDASNYDDLAVGEQLVLEVPLTVTDNNGATTTTSLTITITGTNDGPTIAGDAVGAVTEDASTLTLVDSGTLTLSDADSGEAVFQTDPESITVSTGAFGDLSINAAGEWTYNVANADVQYLSEGEQKVETFTVLSADGTVHEVVVTITGTNDSPALSVSNLAATEDSGAISGTPTFIDLDSSDAHTFSVSSMAVGQGSVSIDATTGEYTYSPGSDFQTLAAGETIDVSFVVTINDAKGGTDTQTVTVTITGSNDAPTTSIAEVLADQNDADGNTITNIDISSAFSDTDNGDTLSYSADNLPEGLSIDPVTGIINGTLDYSASQGGDNNDGVYTVTIYATDSVETANTTFTYTVTNVAAVHNSSSNEQVSNNGYNTHSGLDDGTQLSQTSSYLDRNLDNISDEVFWHDDFTGINPVSLTILLEDQIFYHDELLYIDGIETFTLPANAFQHEDPSETIDVEATLPDGSPLPDYVKFDPDSGEFKVNVTEALKLEENQIVIRVTGYDSEGNSATATFTIFLHEKNKDVTNGDASQTDKDVGSVDESQSEIGTEVQPEEVEQQANPDPELGLGHQLKTLGEGEFATQKARLLMDIEQLFG